MSIQKIARLAGVSVATVSRVLNNSDTVKAKNRERVLQAIKESNYQPNLLARQLRTARSNMILVMVSNIANPFCAEVVKGIEEEAEKNGYRILLCNSGSDLARSTSGLQLLSGKMVDGIITMNALSSLPELTTMIGDAPWVQCAEYADTGSISCVGINDVEAAQGAVSRLADGGRRLLRLQVPRPAPQPQRADACGDGGISICSAGGEHPSGKGGIVAAAVFCMQHQA